MEAGKRREFRLTDLSEPLSHYTDAVAWGDTLYISGIAPLGAAGGLVGGEGVVEQTRQIFENMNLILVTAGASFADVLRVTDVSDRTRINPIRQAYFGSARPASTLIEVPAVAIPGMKVEIEAIVGLRRT